MHQHRFAWGIGRNCLVVVAIFAIFPQNATAQILQSMRDSVRGDGDSPETDPDNCRSKNQGLSWGKNREEDDDSFFNYVGKLVLSAPYTIPIVVLHDENDLKFAKFPYDDHDGFLFKESEQSVEKSVHDALKGPSYSIRLRTEYGNNFDRVDRFNTQFLLETESRFGFKASTTALSERLANGRDTLWLGDGNIVYRFAQSPRAQFRSGIGMNLLADKQKTNLGVNFTYGADFFPKKPWVFSTNVDAGTIGNAALFRFRSTAGVVIRRMEIYTGYEFLNIGKAHTNSLILGVGVWF